MQLPPVILSLSAANLGLSETLFEKVIKYNPQLVRMLKIQHRMNENIMFWSSECMYGGELAAAPKVADQLLGDSKKYKISNAGKLSALDLEDQEYFLTESLFFIETNA